MARPKQYQSTAGAWKHSLTNFYSVGDAQRSGATPALTSVAKIRYSALSGTLATTDTAQAVPWHNPR